MQDIKDINQISFVFGGLSEAIVKTGAALEQLNARLKTQLAGGDAARYPLYCVDRGDRVDIKSQYLGPFTTHADALDHTEDSSDLVRRCRQLRPSEIAFDRDAAALAEYEVFDALIDELDEAACSGNLPEGAWCHDHPVKAKHDGTFPTERDYDTWIDDHASVDAFICEGDE